MKIAGTTKQPTKTLAQSIEGAGIFRIIKTTDGYQVDQLKKDYGDEDLLYWSYEESTKSLRKAKKALYRLSKGQIV